MKCRGSGIRVAWFSCALINLLVGLVLCFPTQAQVPETINYQGRLVDGSGPLNGARTIVIRLFDGAGATTNLYSETQTVTVVDGLYSFLIGASNAVPGDLTAALDPSEVWLEIEVDGELVEKIADRVNIQRRSTNSNKH